LLKTYGDLVKILPLADQIDAIACDGDRPYSSGAADELRQAGNHDSRYGIVKQHLLDNQYLGKLDISDEMMKTGIDFAVNKHYRDDFHVQPETPAAPS
jgi:hypothetical protein